MTNHVHLLVTPHEAGAVSRMMQAIGRRYVACFNARYRRTGTLWEGRFKAALVGSARYTLACYRYIELNPVRAFMVGHPSDYPWSSYGHNAIGVADPRITEHRDYLRLGPSIGSCREVYRDLISERLDDTDVAALQIHTRQQRAFGSDAFREQIEALTDRVARVRPRGRPKAHQSEEGKK